MKKLIFKIVSVAMISSVAIGLGLQLMSDYRNPIYVAMIMVPMYMSILGGCAYLIYDTIFND